MMRKKKQLIALLTPVGLGMHGQVMNGVMNSRYVKEDDFRVFHFFSRGITEEAIAPVVKQILEHPFAAIISVGVSCAYVARKVLEQEKSTIPHIFVGATDPFKYGLGHDHEDLIAHNMTGVLYNRYEIEQAIKYLIEAKPTMRSLLVATERVGTQGTHLDTEWIAREVAAIRSVCEPQGIEVHTHAAQSCAYLYAHVRDTIKTFDTLFLLEGGLSISIFEPLGSLCDQYRKTLFSGLLEPVRQSAALGYGASYESMGDAAMEYVYKLLVEHVSLRELPLVRQENTRKALLNTSLAAGQDVDVEHAEKVCKKWNGIIFDSTFNF